MTTLSDFNGYGEELERQLRLRTFPVAVKLLEKEKDIPEGAIRPKRDLGVHLALCQGFAMSRREGASVAMLKEDNWCYGPVIAFGLAEPPQYWLEGHTYFPLRVRTLEMAGNLMKASPRLECGKYIGVASAPLKTANFEPDVVMIYGDPYQLAILLAGVRCYYGCEVTSTLNPSGVCYRSVVPTIQTGECQAAIPCLGDRTHAIAVDDEMVFSVPKEKVEGLILGLRHVDENEPRLPLKFVMKPEYELSESYVKVSKMLGMEVD